VVAAPTAAEEENPEEATTDEVVPETETPAGVEPVVKPNDFSETGSTETSDAAATGTEEVIPELSPEPIIETKSAPQEPTADDGMVVEDGGFTLPVDFETPADVDVEGAVVEMALECASGDCAPM